MHCILPWGLGKTVETSLVEERERQREWKERVDLGALVLVSYVVLVRVGFGYLSFPTVRYTARFQIMGGVILLCISHIRWSELASSISS